LTESEETKPAPYVSEAPPELPSSYVRKTLTEIKKAQQAQVVIEAERAGAQKLRTRLFAIFGSMITAAAIGGFVWVWDAQASNQSQDAAIERINERAHEHDPTPPGHEEIEAQQATTDRRVDGIERSTKAITGRLDRMEREQATRHAETLAEIRRLRNARRTWGGGQ